MTTTLKAVDAEAVTWAYRLILGRDPESQEVVEYHVGHHATLADLRQSFLASEELRLELEGQRDLYELHDAVEQVTDLVDGGPGRTQGHYLQSRGAQTEGRARFFRDENCNFWPRPADHADGDFLERFVLKGWMPGSRPIDANTRVTTFGSCFAVGIANHLSRIGYDISSKRDPDIYISRMAEGLVNIHAIAQQFEWALEGRTPPASLWHGYDAEEFGYREDIRERTRTVFNETDFFIITLGLSEVWYDEPTGGVLWRSVPMKDYDPGRHKFRVCSMDETQRTIARIYSIIGKHVPQARVLFTLSPIPLVATFRPVGCVTANAASKAILRAALDEFCRDHGSDLNRKLFYFPSYEIANELFADRFEGDGRHPKIAIVQFIMQAFEALYCESGMSLAELNRIFLEKRRVNLARAGRAGTTSPPPA